MEKISLSQWLIYELVDKVDELTEEELEANLDNLAWYLFESENMTGSYYCNAYKARKWIADYMEELSTCDISKEIKWHPIDEPEKYQVCAIVYLSERILQSFDLYGMNKDQLMDYLQNEVDMDAIY